MAVTAEGIVENLGKPLRVIIFVGLVYRPAAEKKKKMIGLYGQAAASSAHTWAKNGLRRPSAA